MQETEITETRTRFTAVVRRALDIGEMIHISGGEVARVEDTVSRICYAYGAERVDILTITSSIVVTVIPPDGEAITQTRRITAQSRDMTKLDALNRLSREICETLPDTEIIGKQLETIKKQRGIPWYITLIAEIIVASCFTVFFGGSWRDAVATVFVALSIFTAERVKSHVRINKIVFFLLTSFIAGAVSVVSVHIGLGHNVNAIMIGAIMLLIPGVAITAAFEDLLTGDTITGLLQLCESVIVAVSIAVGFAMATFVCGGYDMLNDGTGVINPWLQLGAAVFASGGFAVVYGIRKPKRLITAALGGGLTQFSYWLLSMTCTHIVVCLIFAAAVGAAYAQVMARVMRTPATVFTLPAIIPLVPGSLLYYTMSWALRGDVGKFANRGLNTLVCALSIAFGMMFVMVVTGSLSALFRRVRLKKHIK